MRAFRGGIVAALAMLHGHGAQAGVFTDDLTKCLVAKISEADRTVLAQWEFAAMAANPAVAGMVSLTPSQREEYGRKGGDVIARLVASDCRTETVKAVKNEGGAALQINFRVLGGIAMAGLMDHPSVWAEMAKSLAGAQESFAALAKAPELAPAAPASGAEKK